MSFRNLLPVASVSFLFHTETYIIMATCECCYILVRRTLKSIGQDPNCIVNNPFALWRGVSLKRGSISHGLKVKDVVEKQNYNIKYIKTLIDSNGTLITDASSSINEQQKFYKNLYSTKQGSSIDEELDLTEFLQVNTSKLKAMEKQICENDLKIDEVANALKQLPNDKSPGSDGFTANFYKFFWPDIKDFLHESFLYSFKNGELTNDQKRGIINLIPKEGKDLRYLRNWRPLSLLNTDYKILTKTLSNRLQKVLPKLVNEDQVGYIRGRYIGQNIRIIKDIMTYTAKKNLPGYSLLIDFEKAFDSIEWPFLIKCLKLYNFGENFIRWVQLLHKNIEPCVTNNGYLSQPFNLSRGVRQGCPISALLFILVAEILAIQIRENRFIWNKAYE